MITVIADENISHLESYLNHHKVRLIKMAGRDITGEVLQQHRADALLIRSVTPINAQNLANISHLNLQFVGSATIGTDHVDGDFLQKFNISFANAAGCSKHSVAQYVITAILRTLPEARHTPIKLGIIGLGNIGSTLAKYANKLGWQVFGHDPFLAPSAINNATFEQLLQSDVISIHTPLTHTGTHPTAKLISREQLARIRPNALLINTARGEVIDQAALLAAINNKNLTAILDVFENEPHIDDELLKKVSLATPHIAGYTLEGKIRGTDMIYQAFCRHFELPIKQTLAPLLPPNPYFFDELLNKFNLEILKNFYDIEADFAKLQAINHHGVRGGDFDRLRKNYPLRREWIF